MRGRSGGVWGSQQVEGHQVTGIEGTAAGGGGICSECGEATSELAGQEGVWTEGGWLGDLVTVNFRSSGSK